MSSKKKQAPAPGANAFLVAPSASDYTIVKSRLGKGGYGSVKLVQHNKTGAQCAQKTICCADIKELNLAMEEARKLTFLRHPHVVSTEAFFVEELQDEDNKFQFSIIMEFCELGDLHSLIKSHLKSEPFPEEQVWKWLEHISEAVCFVHASGIIHRDMKPQNCFIHQEKDNHLLGLKLGDFGISRKTADAGMTRVGTFEFASPDMCLKKPYSPQIDVWGIGLIFVQVMSLEFPECPYFQLALTNETEFLADLRQAIMRNFNYSQALIDLVLSCCRVNPDLRPHVSDICAAVKSRLAPAPSAPPQVQHIGPTSNPTISPVSSIEKPAPSAVLSTASPQELEALDLDIKRVNKYMSMLKDRVKNPRITAAKLAETQALIDEQAMELAVLQERRNRMLG